LMTSDLRLFWNLFIITDRFLPRLT